MENEEKGVESKSTAALVPRNWRNKNGELHRLSGPAVIYNDGEMWWYKHGKRHRDDGPAIEWPEKGIEDWWKDGEPYEPSAHELMVWKMTQKKKEG